MFRQENVLHIEVSQHPKSSYDRLSLQEAAEDFVRKSLVLDNFPQSWRGSRDLKELYAHIDRIQISSEGVFKTEDIGFKTHVYKLNPAGIFDDFICKFIIYRL